MKNTLSMALLVVLALPLSPALAQEPHPEKKVYADAAAWPATAPGDVKLKHFVPFRAVYDREYTQGSGPGAGEKRQDRVIVHADEVGWEGRRAAAITMIDSGESRFADTNMRTMTMVADLEDLQLLFEMGPLPGKAKDYYIALFSGDHGLVSIVQTEAQQYKPEKMPVTAPGFGPGSWVIAAMELKPGMRINLAPYYSMQANSLSRSHYGRVLERVSIEDGSGTKHEVWIVETSGWYGLHTPKTLRFYLKDTPPYYLGTEIFDYDTNEKKRFVWLRDFQSMGR